MNIEDLIKILVKHERGLMRKGLGVTFRLETGNYSSQVNSSCSALWDGGRVPAEVSLVRLLVYGNKEEVRELAASLQPSSL